MPSPDCDWCRSKQVPGNVYQARHRAEHHSGPTPQGSGNLGSVEPSEPDEPPLGEMVWAVWERVFGKWAQVALLLAAATAFYVFGRLVLR